MRTYTTSSDIRLALTSIFDALTSDAMTLALPILCSLPFTTVFVDDIKSGFIELHLHRCGVKPYIKGKLIACTLSGGLVLLLGIRIRYSDAVTLASSGMVLIEVIQPLRV